MSPHYNLERSVIRRKLCIIQTTVR